MALSKIPIKHYPYSLSQFENDGFGNRRVSIMPSPEELLAHYSANFDRSSYQRRGKIIEAFHRVFSVQSFVKGINEPSILDVGAGNGQFLDACRWRWGRAKLTAMEFKNQRLSIVVDRIKARHFNDIPSILSCKETFDLITLWHVIEHLVDPWSAILNLSQVLKPSGCIVLSTPNMFCPGVRHYPARWPWNQSPPTHLWHFKPEGLRCRLAYLLPEFLLKVKTREARDANSCMDAFLCPLFLDKIRCSTKLRLRIDSIARLFVALLNESLINPLLKNDSGSEIVVVIKRI